ncbi:MAG: ATP-binding cassette domain-containing protein [Bacteroidetes bacterium]|nr:ATP-binding cassette domain-containing protein [Bacteroidota bacterium]
MAKKHGIALEPEEKRKLSKQNLSKLKGIFQFILPYKGAFFLGTIFLFLSSLTLLSFPYVAGKLIDTAQGTNWIFTDLNHIAFLLIGILAVQSVFSFFRVRLFAQVSEKSMRDIRLAVYSRLIRFPIRFFDQRRTGELISRITADVGLLQDTFSTTLAELFRQVVTLVAGIIFLFINTPKLTFFMLGTFPVLVVIAMIFGKYIRRLSKKTQDQLAEANVIVEETLQSIATVKSFVGESYETNRYANGLKKAVAIALQAASFRGAFISFVIFALFGGIVGVMWYGASLVATGELSVGELVSFVLYTTFIGGSIAGLGDIYSQLQRAIGSSERVLELLEEELEPEQGQIISTLTGEIEFNQVSFSYPTRPEVEVLQEISFHIRPGEKIALVGHSGAGKSTITQLLLRLYEASQGTILVDGYPLNAWQLKSLRSKMGVVPQEVLLFGGSIRQNIAYAKPEASEEEIISAAKKANAWQFISQFPEGLDTLVGERGIKLSGGQRQRVAIARAILKDPVLLILDEATSSLDAESEVLVQEALDLLMKGRTSLIIAHRLATIRKADRILVIHEGKIVEQGTHRELVKKSSGIYANLVKLQFAD